MFKWVRQSCSRVLQLQHSDSYSGFSGYFLWNDSIVLNPEWLKPCTSVASVRLFPNWPVQVTEPSDAVEQPPIMLPKTGLVPSYSYEAWRKPVPAPASPHPPSLQKLPAHTGIAGALGRMQRRC